MGIGYEIPVLIFSSEDRRLTTKQQLELARLVRGGVSKWMREGGLPSHLARKLVLRANGIHISMFDEETGDQLGWLDTEMTGERLAARVKANGAPNNDGKDG